MIWNKRGAKINEKDSLSDRVSDKPLTKRNKYQQSFDVPPFMHLSSYLACSIFNRWGKGLDVWYADCWNAILLLFRADRSSSRTKILSLSKSIVPRRNLRFLVVTTVEIDRARVFSWFLNVTRNLARTTLARFLDSHARAIQMNFFAPYSYFVWMRFSSNRTDRHEDPKFHAKQKPTVTIKELET